MFSKPTARFVYAGRDARTGRRRYHVQVPAGRRPKSGKRIAVYRSADQRTVHVILGSKLSHNSTSAVYDFVADDHLRVRVDLLATLITGFSLGFLAGRGTKQPNLQATGEVPCRFRRTPVLDTILIHV